MKCPQPIERKDMEHLTIPIPDGMDDGQKADVTAWFTKLAEELSPKRLPIEDDPAFQEEVTASIKRGMADVNAGRTRPAKEVMREIAAKYGLTVPG